MVVIVNVAALASLFLTSILRTGRAAFVEDLSSRDANCCTSLQKVLGIKVSYPDTAVYTASLTSYWSQQEEQVKPSCIVSPQNTNDVVASLHVLVPGQCNFAIRGGGHTPWAGSANINNGVTIDLSAMNTVSLSAGNTIVSAGPGNKWIDVYSKLDPLGLSVTGGRIADIGVAGLTTGGGMSYFAPRYGFVCDNVVNFEIVLANGNIVNANAGLNQDLFFALKGGSNNFGIVTRFDYKVFKQDLVWGGNIFTPISTQRQQTLAFYNFNAMTPYDEYASLINSYGYSAAAGGLIVANTLVYTKPQAYPPTFAPQTNIQPQILNTMAISNLSTVVIKEGIYQPSGSRQLYITRTYKNNLNLLNFAFDTFSASLPSVTSATNIVYTLVFQPLPPAIYTKSAATGGNPLGLNQNTEPLVLMLISAQWSDAADDDRITKAANGVFDTVDAKAQQSNLTNRWIYLNYADGSQDPIDGYGAGNKAKLQVVSRKFDPTGVFQQRVPGGFKLFK